VVIVLEGRDTAGKDGAIKRLTEHMSPRQTRVVALPKPSDRETTQWYFQRYVPHLPAAGETVIFNRSWYNRGGVEPVMGFCTKAEAEVFLRDVPAFESMLIDSGITLIKLWLDISKDEQDRRLDDRRSDPLKALKVSPLDAVAQEKWKAYSAARDEMLTHSHSVIHPWVCVKADDKKAARLAIIQHILSIIAPAKLRKGVDRPDPAVLFQFEPEALGDGRLAR
jgi:polyphosphate kinase 2